MNDRRTAIVTGAGTGIGKATALRFARDGYNVVLNGTHRAPLEAVAEEIGAERSAVAVADVSKPAEAARIVRTAVASFGGVDVVVNNAGVMVPGTPDMLPTASFERMLAVNVGGVRNVTLAALPELRKSKGSVVNVSSVSGLRGDWAMYGYNASKGAVSVMTQAMALDLGRDGVRVNAVAPATTNTRIAEPVKNDPALKKALNRRVPMGRMAEPEEVASVIAFLAGADAAFVNGVVLPVDGGLSASSGQPDFLAD